MKRILILLTSLFLLSSSAWSAGTLKVTTPNGGQKWTTGKSYAVKWSKGNAGAKVKIQLLKSGKHYKWISKKTKNDGKHTWKIPSSVATGSAYKIKIVSIKNKKVFDTSNKTFKITKAASGGTLAVTTPNGGQKWSTGKSYQIKWSKGTAGAKVKIQLLKDGKTYKWISKSTSNDGKHTWKIPSTVATASTYKVKITSTTKKTVTDSSNSNFKITKSGGGGNSLKVSTPNGGESWITGKTYQIKWSKGNAGSKVKIQLLKNGKAYKWISKSTKNDGKHTWKIPSTVATASTYKIKITSTTKKTVTDASTSNFTITEASTSKPKVTLSCSPSSVSETGGKSTCTLSLSESTTKFVKVELAYSGTATAGTDYSGNYASRTIKKGTTSTSWELTGKADNENEGDEAIVINVVSVTNATEKGVQKASLVLTNSSTNLEITSPKAGDVIWFTGYPIEGGPYLSIDVTWSVGDADYVRVTILKSGNVLKELILSSRYQDYSYRLDACDDASGDDYEIKIREVNAYGGSIPGGKEVKSGRFTVKWGSVKLLYPKGGETLKIDEYYDIEVEVNNWKGRVWFEIWHPPVPYPGKWTCPYEGWQDLGKMHGTQGTYRYYFKDGKTKVGIKFRDGYVISDGKKEWVGCIPPNDGYRLRASPGYYWHPYGDACYSKNFPGITGGDFSVTE